MIPIPDDARPGLFDPADPSRADTDTGHSGRSFGAEIELVPFLSTYTSEHFTLVRDVMGMRSVAYTSKVGYEER